VSRKQPQGSKARYQRAERIYVNREGISVIGINRSMKCLNTIILLS
jgi:hypothetical protein